MSRALAACVLANPRSHDAATSPARSARDHAGDRTHVRVVRVVRALEGSCDPLLAVVIIIVIVVVVVVVVVVIVVIVVVVAAVAATAQLVTTVARQCAGRGSGSGSSGGGGSGLALLPPWRLTRQGATLVWAAASQPDVGWQAERPAQ